MESIIAIGVAGIAIIGLLFQHFAVLSGIKERLTSLETKMELFWTAIQSRTVEMLKSPNTPRKDELLDKLQDHSINMGETMELSRMLSEQVRDKKSPDRQMACVLVIARLELVVYDLGKKK